MPTPATHIQRTHAFVSRLSESVAGGADAKQERPHDLIGSSLDNGMGAVLIDEPALEGGDLLQGQTVAVPRTTNVYAVMFTGVSRRKGERFVIGISRLHWYRRQCQCYEEGGDDRE
jgi:hypothetical protein